MLSHDSYDMLNTWSSESALLNSFQKHKESFITDAACIEGHRGNNRVAWRGQNLVSWNQGSPIVSSRLFVRSLSHCFCFDSSPWTQGPGKAEKPSLQPRRAPAKQQLTLLWPPCIARLLRDHLKTSTDTPHPQQRSQQNAYLKEIVQKDMRTG